MVRSSSQPELHSNFKLIIEWSENVSNYPSGTTLHTTDTEYTMNKSEILESCQSHSPNLQTGSSITSLSTGLNTPVQREFLSRDSSKMTVGGAVKLFKTALIRLNSKASESNGFEHNHSKAGSS